MVLVEAGKLTISTLPMLLSPAAIDGVTFPQGMTIFGRWDGFTLASGKVIGYIGYV